MNGLLQGDEQALCLVTAPLQHRGDRRKRGVLVKQQHEELLAQHLLELHERHPFVAVAQ